MVRRKPKDLLEMIERLVNIVFVVEAEPTDIDGIDVGAVLPEEIVGDLLGLGVPAEVSEAFGSKQLDGS